MGKTVGDGFDHIGALVEVMVQGALDVCVVDRVVRRVVRVEVS